MLESGVCDILDVNCFAGDKNGIDLVLVEAEIGMFYGNEETSEPAQIRTQTDIT